MATAVVMPKLGNTVESSIIVSWKKKKGDPVVAQEVLCEVETDKAMLELESPASGTLLELFFKEGDDVPILTNIAAIGQPGENVDSLRPAGATTLPAAQVAPAVSSETASTAASTASATSTNGKVVAAPSAPDQSETGISPRARNLAASKGLDVNGLQGTGPRGRIIERDIQAALTSRPKVTPLAKSMLAGGDFVAPEQGSGFGGRITSKDLRAASAASAAAAASAAPGQPEPRVELPAAGEDEIQVIPVKGTRKVIAARMLNSLQTTAQLTLNASADARAMLDYRKRLKGSPEALGLSGVTINDLVLFVVSRTLLQYPDLNALFTGDTISQYHVVHLGFAVDTPRGLIVPVIKRASTLSLKQIADESRRLSTACLDGTVSPDDLGGGTFTVTNLGSLGIENFTPVLNVPQVGILGVGNINLKPVEVDGEVKFVPHLGLSLTINHQVVDGAPGARFLQSLSRNITELGLVLAL